MDSTKRITTDRILEQFPHGASTYEQIRAQVLSDLYSCKRGTQTLMCRDIHLNHSWACRILAGQARSFTSIYAMRFWLDANAEKYGKDPR